MKAIGGFLEIEELKESGSEYHKAALRLNTGRNSLKYLARAHSIKKIFTPFYNCGAVAAALADEKIEYQFYRINANLEPIFDFEPENDDFLLYVNYFGICRNIADSLVQKYENLIIDNSQAFFEIPPQGQIAFNSVRKFFGVPDGSYLYTPRILNRDLEQDVSTRRTDHLYKRTSESPEAAYSMFLENERQLETLPMRKMSELTAGMLDRIDYRESKAKRNENFLAYHAALKDINGLHVNTENLNGPLAYPLEIESEGLRKHLISKRIFIPSYWNEVLNLAGTDSVEARKVRNVYPLPCDQRYDIRDSETVIEEIRNYIKNK